MGKGKGKVSDGFGKVAADDSIQHAVAAKIWLLNRALYGSRQIYPNQSHVFNKTLEQQTLSDLQVIKAETGRILCSFVVPKHLSDADGNWHPGAIATIIDDVCGAAIITETGLLKASAALSISYFSPAKIHEEVEIEGRVIGHKGKLTSVIAEVRKKGRGQLIAVAKQWMSGATPIKSNFTVIFEIEVKKLVLVLGRDHQQRFQQGIMEHAVIAKRWLQKVGAAVEIAHSQSHDFNNQTLEQQTLSGIQIVKAESGRILCFLSLKTSLSLSLSLAIKQLGGDGNWHPGAIATAVDNICGATIVAGTEQLEVPWPEQGLRVNQFKISGCGEHVPCLVVGVWSFGGKLSDGSGKAAAAAADDSIEHAVAAKKWLLNHALHGPRQIDPNQAHDFNKKITMEQHTLSGLQVIKAESGRIVCSFVVPKHLSDADGNWVPGAIATAVDCICGATIMAGTGQLKVSAAFSLSYFSPAKIHEEVEIEGRVIGHAGNLSSVTVEVRKKGSGHLVTVAKQWMAAALPTKSKL
ncbi:hypothetical protein ACLOJK_021195 [Asimina triloba]